MEFFCKGSRRKFENLNLIQLVCYYYITTTAREPENWQSKICIKHLPGGRHWAGVGVQDDDGGDGGGDDGGGGGDVDLPGGGHQGTRMELVKNCRKASATARAECAGLELLQPCGGYKVIQTLCFRIFTASH